MRMTTGAIARLVALPIALAIVSTTAPGAASASGDVSAHFDASFAAEAKGDYARALNEILEVVRKTPDDYVATLRAGWLYYKKGQHEDAEITYRRAVELRPRSIEARQGLTLPLMALARWKSVEAVCKEVLAVAPAEYTALSRLAYAQYARGAFREAAETYGLLNALWPSDVEMMLGLGWAQLKLGNAADAKRLFQRVLQLRKHSVRAQAGLEACG